jgi:hypothetical protein
MTSQHLDQFQRDLGRQVDADAAAFEQKFGRNAKIFLEALPGVFMVLRRTALDMDAGPSSRRLAAAGALYLVETHDFLQRSSAGVGGWLDDIWVGWSAFARLLDQMDEARLEPHWRFDGLPFAEGRALAANIEALKPIMPSRVLEVVERYLS